MYVFMDICIFYVYVFMCMEVEVFFILQEIADCFQVLSGILNVGNMKFATKEDSNELFVNTTESIEYGNFRYFTIRR